MEWNATSPGQWDWNHLSFLNAKATENPKLQSTDWNAEADRAINAGLVYASGGSGSGCSESELIHASSRSSKSASINSSSNVDSKPSMFTFEGSQDDSTCKKELSKEEPVETSPAPEPSLLTLKLGKRLYFEDVSAATDLKKPSPSSVVLPSSSLSTVKKWKSNTLNSQIPICCQVEGCGLDLSSAKEYHRKHRVCGSHSKTPKVVVAGLERRFCQQCSRFHSLSEFDDKKRSCRRRLSDHNARRRKPHPEAVQLNPSALFSSSYDGRQLVSPFAYARTATNLGWQDIQSSKLPLTKDFLLKPVKAYNKIPSTAPMLSNGSIDFPSKGIESKSTVLGKEDPPNSITSSDPNATQDVSRALSLLSTNSWGAYDKSLPLEHSNRTTHALPQRFPFPSSEYWHADQQPPNSSMCFSFSDCDNTNRFQDFQLFNSSYESGFPCNQLD